MATPLVESSLAVEGDVSLEPSIDLPGQMTNPNVVINVVAEDTTSRSPMLSLVHEVAGSSQMAKNIVAAFIP